MRSDLFSENNSWDCGGSAGQGAEVGLVIIQKKDEEDLG